jgi:hypothetical protein
MNRHLSNSTARSLPSRPRLGVVLLVYVLWLGTIAAIATRAELEPFSGIAIMLSLFVCLPYWAYKNWADVVADLPATYATLMVAALLMVLFCIQLNWDVSSLRYRAVQSGLMQPKETWRLDALEYAVYLIVFFNIPPLWRFLRRRLSSAPGT